MVRAMPAFLSRSFLGASAALLALLVLAGCASGPSPSGPRTPSPGRDGPPTMIPPDLAKTPDPEPKVEPIRQGGPNKPYTVMGQSYEPMVADVPWKQRGIASWYGQKFHGRRTASGELFSLYGLTAAHRTLPIPSYVRVRNVANGRETIVRVNDRGPFHSNRVLDLSYAAALKLGIVATGSAEVELERLTFDDIRTGAWRRDAGTAVAVSSSGAASVPVPPPAQPVPDEDPIAALATASASAPAPGDQPAPVPNTAPVPAANSPDRAYTPAARGFWVQLAALGRRDGVDKLQQRVNAELASLTPFMAVFKEAALYRLQVGPYESREQAQGVARAVREALALTPMVIERR